MAATPAVAEAKEKKKFLSAYPALFKFALFWWCMIVFAVISVFIIDLAIYRFKGSALVTWKASFRFDARASREAYWAEFINPKEWRPEQHPVLQSADVVMVKCLPSRGGQEAGEASAPASDKRVSKRADEDRISENPSERLVPVDYQPLRPGLGLVLRYKEDSGDRSGLFHCARECTQLETPEDGPWTFEMRTVEVGSGHAYIPGTEQVIVTLHPQEAEGCLCEMEGKGEVQSRLFLWWQRLPTISTAAAEAMMHHINDELGRPKKDE